MKIKILKIIKVGDIINNTSKTTGKPYSIYQYWCDIDNNGMQGKYVIKTMSKAIADSFKEGNDYEVKEQTFNNQVSYMIDTQANKPTVNTFQKKLFYQQGKMTKTEYLTFVTEVYEKAKELAKEDNELLKTLFDKILGCGCVLIDTNKNNTTEKINDTFNNNENNEDEKIPF